SFRTAAEKFRLIDEKTYSPVLVSYQGGKDILGRLREQGPERQLLRRAQRYIVNLPRHVHERLIQEGAIEEVHPGIYVQGYDNLYDNDLGFCADRFWAREPDELII
ncbi:MAG: CRISPR-associated helicase/endonuclease Cas3, partial [Desulfobulbus sp.]|nr:CRISPR-associated helicase/endonuclease Cas3 [Desulfobulbus sp.]